MSNPRLMNGMGSPQSVYSTSTTQEHAIGTRGILPDGRVYYYTRNGTTSALAKGSVLAAAAIVGNHSNQTVAAAADVTAGATSVVANIGGTLAGVGVYNEGYFAITDGTAQGDIYQIREFPGGASSTDITVEIYGSVQTSAGGSDTFTLIQNLYSNPIVHPASKAGVPVGVPNAALAAATTAATATAAAVDATYGWVQTWGPCLVLMDETSGFTVGTAAVSGEGEAGAVELADAAGELRIGTMMDAAVDTEYQPVDLRIRP